MSTIRFGDLVRVAGTPEPKSLWTDPKEDRDFMRAVKQNRILTVPKDALSPEELRRAKPARIKSSWKEKPEPQAKIFHVLVRRVATLDATIAVEARTKKEAREKGIETVQGQDFDVAKAKIRNEIRVAK